MSAANRPHAKRLRRLERRAHAQEQPGSMVREVPCLHCGHKVFAYRWQAPFHGRCVRKAVKALIQP